MLLGLLAEASLRSGDPAQALAHCEAGLAVAELAEAYRDSGFDGTPAPGTLCAAPVEEVAGVLARLVADLRPRVVVVLDGSDGHRDHAHVREAAHRAWATVDGPALYEICLPNSLMRRWLTETQAARGDDAYHAIDPAVLGRPDAEVTDAVDVADVLPLREGAMAEHRSQASPYEGLGDELRRAFLTTDHLVRVR